MKVSIRVRATVFQYLVLFLIKLLKMWMGKWFTVSVGANVNTFLSNWGLSSWSGSTKIMQIFAAIDLTLSQQHFLVEYCYHLSFFLIAIFLSEMQDAMFGSLQTWSTASTRQLLLYWWQCCHSNNYYQDNN
jgi:hypothetical protein